MSDRLGELADLPLSAARQPRQRLVGCCRDFTVLFVCMARHKGIPARTRADVPAVVDVSAVARAAS